MTTYLAQGVAVLDEASHVIETWGSTSKATQRAAELNAEQHFEFTPSDNPDDYLVVEDRKKSSTWHLQVKVGGKPDHKLMGAAKAALTSPGGHRGQTYKGPNKAQAIADLKKLYQKEKMEFAAEVVWLMDTFVNTQPGEPYRLFPFGEIHKNGAVHTITPEYARTFRLPPFKPPIKLGSHDDTTPAGGHLVRLEVRGDGLYGYPELTDKGVKAVKEGDFRYHSPEVIWDEQGLEDPTTGELITGPLIVGDALLHTPHLGESAAMYSIEPFHRGGPMSQVMDENISIPRTWFERFFGLTSKSATTEPPPATPETPPPPIAVAESDAFKAAVKERDELKARLLKIEAEQAQTMRLSKLVTELQDKSKYGACYVSMTEAQAAASMLDTMNDDQRAWVLKNFSAYIHQIDESRLTGEIGTTGQQPGTGTTEGTAALALDTAVHARMQKDHLSYETALAAIQKESPDLFKAYLKERG